MVACKILLSTALGACSEEEAVAQALTLSNPVLENLHKEAGLVSGFWVPVKCCVMGRALCNGGRPAYPTHPPSRPAARPPIHHTRLAPQPPNYPPNPLLPARLPGI